MKDLSDSNFNDGTYKADMLPQRGNKVSVKHLLSHTYSIT